MATAFANADANADGRISMEDRLWWVWLWFGWHMVALDSLVWGQNMQKTSKNTSNPVAPISTNIQNGVLMLKTTCSNSCSLIVLCKTTTSWSFKCQDTHTHITPRKRGDWINNSNFRSQGITTCRLQRPGVWTALWSQHRLWPRDVAQRFWLGGSQQGAK